MPCVLPDVTGFLLESCPGFEIRNTRSTVFAINAFHLLLEFFKTHRSEDNLIVVSQRARRQIDEDLKFRILFSVKRQYCLD
jgi:hypothetical protein